VSRSSEGVDPQERTRMLAEQRREREREFEVCVRGAGGEHQNVCYGERYATTEEARLALSVLVDDGAVDEAAALRARGAIVTATIASLEITIARCKAIRIRLLLGATQK